MRASYCLLTAAEFLGYSNRSLSIWLGLIWFLIWTFFWMSWSRYSIIFCPVWMMPLISLWYWVVKLSAKLTSWLKSLCALWLEWHCWHVKVKHCLQNPLIAFCLGLLHP